MRFLLILLRGIRYGVFDAGVNVEPATFAASGALNVMQRTNVGSENCAAQPLLKDGATFLTFNASHIYVN